MKINVKTPNNQERENGYFTYTHKFWIQNREWNRRRENSEYKESMISNWSDVKII